MTRNSIQRPQRRRHRQRRRRHLIQPVLKRKGREIKKQTKATKTKLKRRHSNEWSQKNNNA